MRGGRERRRGAAGRLVLLALLLTAGPALGERRELSGVAHGYRALVYRPAAAAEHPAWPLLLYLHGAVERGDDLERAAATGPPYEIERGRSLPLVVVAPLLPAGERWEPERLRAVLDAVVASEPVDRDRVYVSGKSLGGFGAWALATAFPTRFAALVPVSAAGDPETVCTLAGVRVWAFHNRDDPVVPVARTQAAIDALRRCGGRARLTVYPASGHDAWSATYAREDLWVWLLAQRRGAPPAPAER